MCVIKIVTTSDDFRILFVIFELYSGTIYEPPARAGVRVKIFVVSIKSISCVYRNLVYTHIYVYIVRSRKNIRILHTHDIFVNLLWETLRILI